jgi:O-antigen/teichoic acid export membrane protein
VIYGFGQGFNLITPLLVMPYLIAVCGLENFGQAAFGMSLAFFLIVFIDYGSDIIGVKAIAENRDDAQKMQQIFTTTYSAKFVVLLAVLAVMSLVFIFVPFFNKESSLFFLGLPILVGQFLNPTWFLQGIEDFTQITIVNIISKLTYVLGVFAMVHSRADFIYINLWWGIGMVFANTLSFLYIVRRFGFKFSEVGKTQIIGQLKENFYMFSSQIFVSIQLYAPLMLIGFFGTPLMAGIYRVADQVVVIFRTYILLFFNFVFPRVCYLIEKNLPEGLRFWKLYNGVNFVFIFLAMCAIFGFSNTIVHYFKPDDLGAIASLMRWAIFTPLLMAISVPLKQLLLGFNYQQFYIRYTVMSVIAAMLLIVLLLPFYGNYGVVLALVTVETISVILFYLRIKNRLIVR